MSGNPGVPPRRYSGNGLRRCRRPMVGCSQRQNIQIVCVGSCHDHRQVDSFGAGICQVNDQIVVLGHRPGQLFGQMRRCGMVEHRCAMGKVPSLGHRGLYHARIRMTDRNADIHHQQVGVLAAFVVPKILAPAFLKNNRIGERDEFTLRSCIKLIATRGCAGEAPVCWQIVVGHGLTLYLVFIRVLSGS